MAASFESQRITKKNKFSQSNVFNTKNVDCKEPQKHLRINSEVNSYNKSNSNVKFKYDKQNNFKSKNSELCTKDNNEILLRVLDKQCGFLYHFKERNIKQDVLVHMLIALGKACCSDLLANVNELIKNVSYIAEDVLSHMQRFLAFLIKRKALEAVYIDSVLSIVTFLEKFQSIMPSSSSIFMSILIPLLDSTCEKCIKINKDKYDFVKLKIKEINEQNEFFLDRHTLFAIKKTSVKEKLSLQKPPESFRSLSVLPTSDDVKLPCSFLRPNIIKGKYTDTEHYLDVQFRLLREDYIMPLRDGISEYLSLKKNNVAFKRCNNVNVYCDVYINSEDFVFGDLVHRLKFSDKKFSGIQWDKSKLFLTGSLLCLSFDDFKTMFFASVVKRDPINLKEGFLDVKFEEITDEVLNLQHNIKFVVLETSAYFEAYRHNLIALLQLNSDILPFKRYILDVERTVNHPLYLEKNTVYDMEPLFFPLNHRFEEEDDEVPNSYDHVDVLNDESWPLAAELKLDDSQLSALKAAITKEFALIQGPPGTGKTYIGLRIVQLLLHNMSTWYDKEKNPLPILVVCFTNHALDQFLEGLLLFTSKVVRIGGRSKNEKILALQLYELKKSAICDKALPRYLRSNIYDRNEQLQIIKTHIDKNKKCIEECAYKILDEKNLEKYIYMDHFQTLQNGFQSQNSKKKFTVLDWLGIDRKADLFEIKIIDTSYRINYIDTFAANEDISSEDEVDIECIENERIIDSIDYDEQNFCHISEDVDKCDIYENSQWSQEDPEWKTEAGKKKNEQIKKYINDSLNDFEAMTEEEVMQIENVWSLEIEKRWNLYKYWLNKYVIDKKIKAFRLQKKLKEMLKEINEVKAEEDLYILKNKAYIVGMTTNGAAKYRHLVHKLNPAILIVEEAAEVLESHIVTSLAPDTQHVILIGDQQQLRPSPTMHMLAVKYDLNVSLFERMVLNEMEYCRLSVQHRMRPEIASLIVPHIYPNLENHKDVTEFENIKGLRKNVFFVSHNLNELSENNSKSKSNKHEALFLIEFCRYLILQEYDPSRITVLTTYTGQLFLLKDLATGDVKKVRFAVVDNFQGEENDIILISFVRSNEAGQIGFLKIPNRVCVALSRAKKGLFCIGNFSLLSEKSDLWKNIVKTLVQNEAIGSSLQLVCQNHPDVCTEVSGSADFKNVPEGGCSQKCDKRLPCGHACLLMCHPYDKNHEIIKCKKPCARICERNHSCPKQCFEICYCKVLTERTLKNCSHVITEICGKPEADILCRNPCEKKCERGHPCEKECYDDCYCEILINVTLPKCGHSIEKVCGLPENEVICTNSCDRKCAQNHKCEKSCFEICYCEVLVEKKLPKCGHTVTDLCGKREINIVCQLKCEKKLLFCTHQCPKKCGEKCIIDCKEPCLKTCKEGHKCHKQCYEGCGNCKILVDKICKFDHKYQVECHKQGICPVTVEKTLKKCGHVVKMPCGKNEMLYFCMLQCKKRLECSHNCPKKCSESCVPPINCSQPCLKTCDKGHKCPKLCNQSCGPCRIRIEKTLKCGHTVKALCGKLEEKIICSFKCEKKLPCGHVCTERCGESCTKKCMQFKEVKSSICGHSINIECYIVGDKVKERAVQLSHKCTEPCKVLLPCTHRCTGTCGRCRQKRLHIPCEAICKNDLICGHKCQAKCSVSCPPCQQRCENKCVHMQCPRKCSEPCQICTKHCKWSCIHKKCTQPCYKLCNRGACEKPCTKVLPCNHQCIGFCGEPCPKLCKICDYETENVFHNAEENAVFVLLEDCGHIFPDHELDQHLNNHLKDSKRICLIACPFCKKIIRKNLHYSHFIKENFFKIEQIKNSMKLNERKSTELQNTLLRKSLSLTTCHYFDPNNNIQEYLSAVCNKNIHDLNNVENILSIAVGLCNLHIKNFNPDLSFQKVLNPLIQYANYACKWIVNFILRYFLIASEFQLLQLTYEIRRLEFIGRLLQIAEPKLLESNSLEFQNCSHYLLDYSPFDDSFENLFLSAFQTLISKSVRNNISYKYYAAIEFPYLKAINMSVDHWYLCYKGHVYCIITYPGTINKGCYECLSKNKETVPNSDKSAKTSFRDKVCRPSSIIFSGKESEQMYRQKEFLQDEIKKDRRENMRGYRNPIQRFNSACSGVIQRFDSAVAEYNSSKKEFNGSVSKSQNLCADFKFSVNQNYRSQSSSSSVSDRMHNNQSNFSKTNSKSSQHSGNYRLSKNQNHMQKFVAHSDVGCSSSKNKFFELHSKSPTLIADVEFSKARGKGYRSQSSDLSEKNRPFRKQNLFGKSYSKPPTWETRAACRETDNKNISANFGLSRHESENRFNLQPSKLATNAACSEVKNDDSSTSLRGRHVKGFRQSRNQNSFRFERSHSKPPKLSNK